MPNPSDIAKVMQKTQEMINATVDTIAATTQTQAYLEKNILITDKKINIHDKNETAHDDIREQLASMSRTMISEPDVEGPKYIETNMEGTWTFKADAIIASVKINSFKVIDEEGNEFTVQADAHGVGTFTHAFVGTRNQETYFTVTAIGSYSSQSPATQFDFTITQHLPPVLDSIEVEAPTRVSHGKSYNLTISNFEDPDDDFVDYSITSNHPDKVSISKDVGIGNGETISFTMANDLQGGDLIFTITAFDAWDMYTEKDITPIPINRDPQVTSFTHTYPNNLTKGNSILARVSGPTDPDGDPLTYDISSSIPQITFSKTSGIQLNEDITVSVASTATPNTPYTLTFTFKDPYGGTVQHTLSSVINNPPVMTNFQCHQETYHIPGNTTKMSFTGVTDVDEEPITFSIVNTNTNISFSKTSNIQPGEEIDVTPSSASVHGQTYNITVQARDTSGAVSEATVGIRINNVIAAASIATNIASVVKPGATNTWKITTAVDQDSQELTYSVSCTNSNVTLSNNTNIKANANFTCVANLGTGLARGGTFNLVIAAFDGYETVTKTVTVKMNSLPVATNVVQTGIPSDFKGGTENQKTFKLSGGTDVDNQTVTYNITDIDTGLTISKTSGIAANENLTIYATKVSTATNKTFKVVPVDAFGEAGEGKVITITVNPIVVTAAPSITYPTNNLESVPHYEGFTMTWSAYAETADTDMTHTTYPWNDSVSWTS